MAKLTARLLKMLRENGVTYYRDADGTVLRLAPLPPAEEELPPEVKRAIEQDRQRRRGMGAPPSDERADLGLPEEPKRPADWSPTA